MRANAEGITAFQRTLLEWWRTSARDYPWRHRRSPYRTAIAELMLRRTRADQVVPVYEEFVTAFPTLSIAARADPDTIKQMLYPLGLSWRAQNVVDFVQAAHAQFGDDIPLDQRYLKQLPGIGAYVSAAILCFAGGLPEPMVDTNVVRVLGRVFGLDTVGEARRRADMRRLARDAVAVEAAADYHYAVLDFAAKVCLTRAPRCPTCPFGSAGECEYFTARQADAVAQVGGSGSG